MAKRKSLSKRTLKNKVGKSLPKKKSKVAKGVQKANPKTKPVTQKGSKKKRANIFSLQLPTIGLWEFNVKSGNIIWSENAHRFFHLRDDSRMPTSFDALSEFVYQADRFRFKDQFSKAVTEGTHFFCESRIKIPGGSYVWLEFTGNPELPARGRIAKFFGSVQDITSKKLTEYELVDWKTRNDLVSESAGLLIYDYDVVSGEIIWSGNTEQVVGYTNIELGRIENWQELVHPEDRDEANRLLELAKKQLTPYDVYYRFRIKNKDYCYMHDRGLFVADPRGEAVRMLGIMSDVSERVAAIKTVEQSEKSYRELFDCVGEAIYIQDFDGTFLDVNREACSIYGYTKEELIGKSPEFLSAPGKNDFEKLGVQIQEALKGKPQKFIWWGKKKSGEVFLKEVRLTRGTYFGAVTVIATAFDITEKVGAERSLQESEKRFRRMIEDLNVGVLLQGPKGEVQIANRASLSLLQISEETLFQKTLKKSGLEFVTEEGTVIHEADLPWVVAAKTKKPIRGVVAGLRVNDSASRTWLLINAEPTLLDQEKLLHVLITLTDITERKKIEESLKESELRFRTLQEASFGGIGLHSKGMIIDCNQGLCDITGFTYDELIGSNGLNLIAPEYRDYVLKKILSKDENPYDVEGMRKDGSRYFLEIHGKNIPYGDGLIRVTEFRDITDRKIAEASTLEQNARLRTITEDLQLKNDQLREFTQIVSHNLRAPVGNILSLLNFIEVADTDAERDEYIALLKEAGTKTLTTLHELNEVLQIKQNKNIERQVLSFEEVYANVRSMLSARIAESKAVINIDFSEAPTIEYPNIYLESIMLNLLSNALKYTHPDRRPDISIKSFLTGNSVSLRISDNGAGINMQRYGDHIFKLRKTFHKHPESRGIGLFMIKNQIEAMGGDISVSSVEHEGSTFLINFKRIPEQ